MTSYRVYLRSDIQWTMRTFKARSPERAIELARRFVDERFDELDFADYEPNDCPINEIEILDEHGNELAVWHDEDLRLRLAARDLLDALEKAVRALNEVPRFKVPGLDTDSYKIAAICDRAIAKA